MQRPFLVVLLFLGVSATAAQVEVPNIILITVDTTRADRMGFLGSKLNATPNLDALAKQGVVFEQAYSQAPLTPVSFFFQAEDGIRHLTVTGVQTCALPIYVPVISDALPEDKWSGRTGFVRRAVMEDLSVLYGHQVYACGVPIMVDSARRVFIQK